MNTESFTIQRDRNTAIADAQFDRLKSYTLGFEAALFQLEYDHNLIIPIELQNELARMRGQLHTLALEHAARY
jgi:hypothetical protein